MKAAMHVHAWRYTRRLHNDSNYRLHKPWQTMPFHLVVCILSKFIDGSPLLRNLREIWHFQGLGEQKNAHRLYKWRK